MTEPLPDQIQTSLYLQQTNSDFKVIVCAPCIEYHLSAKNFTFVKSLTREELKYLCEKKFSEWDSECLNFFAANKNFNEVCPKSLGNSQ